MENNDLFFCKDSEPLTVIGKTREQLLAEADENSLSYNLVKKDEMWKTAKLIHADCLLYMKLIPDKSVDMILCDLPYGTTACKWDNVIPFAPLWEQYNRIIKPNCAIVLFGREPFTATLINSNIKNYKHKWVWNKKQSGSFMNAKYMPLQIEEDIIVFCKDNAKVKYYPIMRKGKMRMRGGAKKPLQTSNGLKNGYVCYSDEYYPTNILDFPNCCRKKNNTHPTEKPVELLEYLINTYTQEGETVLDNCMGSGSTGVACVNTNRKFIGIEKEKKYYDIATKRVYGVLNGKFTKQD